MTNFEPFVSVKAITHYATIAYHFLFNLKKRIRKNVSKINSFILKSPMSLYPNHSCQNGPYDKKGVK